MFDATRASAFRRKLIPIIGLLLWSSMAEAQGVGRHAGAAEELLVGLRAGASGAALDAMLGEEGAARGESVRGLAVHRVMVPEHAKAHLKVRLAKRADVEFVEENSLVAPDAMPNDPEMANAWHLPKIGAPAAWDVSRGSSVIVAILDSGIAPNHVDLQGKLVPGRNLHDGNNDTTDLSGHGTRVAGLAAAATDNGVGVAAPGWSSLLMPVRVTLPDGSAYLSTIASGLTWAADHGARVMNVSFTAVASSATVRSAAQYVQSKGGMVVASSGNCGCDDPTAENPYVLSVGATDATDAVKDFSSRGAYVDLAAPGVMLRTTRPEGDYSYVGGTSFASPVVAGVVALMMAANPSASPGEIESWLEETAKDLGTAGWDSASGFGRIQADLAVALAASSGSTPPPADTVPPAVSIQSPGATVSGTVTVSVSAIDDVAVASVTLSVDGVVVGTDSSAPHSFAWNTTTASNGTHTLTATAVDSSGNATTSSPVSVNVSNVDAVPTVSITSPTEGSSVTKSVRITVSAADDRGLSRIEVSIDGQVLSSVAVSGKSANASVTWNTKGVSRTTHRISARSIDTAGGSSTIAAVNVTVR